MTAGARYSSFTPIPHCSRGIVGRVQARMDAAEQRVAASTFFLGFAARLWSIGLGALAGHRLLPELDAEHLLFRECDGQIQLHIEHPGRLATATISSRLLADMVLEQHLAPLSAALRHADRSRTSCCAAMPPPRCSAPRVSSTDKPTSGRGWQLARSLCSDERLSEAICFSDAGYRRTSCCLYYRAPRGGLCGDCSMADGDQR